jgi:hypothetical protein
MGHRLYQNRTLDRNRLQELLARRQKVNSFVYEQNKKRQCDIRSGKRFNRENTRNDTNNTEQRPSFRVLSCEFVVKFSPIIMMADIELTLRNGQRVKEHAARFLFILNLIFLTYSKR